MVESTVIKHRHSCVIYSRFTTSIFYCRLPDNRVPFAVSLNTNQSVTSHNLLPVRSQIVKPEDKKGFAVCVSPLFGKYNFTYELIQWIELNRILGAELFVFYNYSTGDNINDVLRFYEKTGLVQVVQWNLTKFRFGSKPELVYNGQRCAMNDCLMKVKNVSEYVVNIDLDEFIVPHSNLSTWRDIVQTVPKRSGFTFRMSFFRLNWDNTDRQFLRKDKAEELHLSTLLKLYRDSNIFPPGVRTKYFVKTNAAEVLGVHSMFELLPGHRADTVSTDIGLLHHYKIIYGKVNGKVGPDKINNVPRVLDDTVNVKYGAALIDNVIKVHKELYGARE